MRNKNKIFLIRYFFLFLFASVLFTACKDSENVPNEAENNNQPTGPAADLYNLQCVGCHSLGGGDGVGPDLAGISLKRERDWIFRWLEDTETMLETDPIGQELLEQYTIPMPQFPLTEENINLLLNMFEQFDRSYIATNQIENQELEITIDEWTIAREQYQNHCASCHGSDRQGNEAIPSLLPEQMTNLGATAIRTSLAQNPVHQNLLEEQNFELMIRFIRLELPQNFSCVD